MGWLLAEAYEKWNAKHGPKIACRDYLKKKLTGDISVRAGTNLMHLLDDDFGNYFSFHRISYETLLMRLMMHFFKLLRCWLFIT